MPNSQTSEDQPDRAATRATIMETARAVAARDGVEKLTLSKVAAECGLQRAAVYGQFARKEDLLMSIVSEDLASLARTMSDVEWPKHEGGDTPESAVILSLPRPVNAEAEAEADPAAPAQDVPQAETSAEAIDLAKDVSNALATNQTDGNTPPEPRQRLLRRADIAQLLGAQVAPDDGEPKEPRPADNAPDKVARAPDAWLERRLRVFERAMTAMEGRQEQVEKNSRAAAVTSEEAIKALEATVKELQERADAAEARLKASSNEVRAALNETTLRIQTVEGVARAALAENRQTEEPAVEPATIEPVEPAADLAEQAAAPEAPTAEAPVAESTDAEASATDAPKSFIAEARKNAVAAAAAAQATAATEPTTKKVRNNLTRYLLGGAAVLAIFVAAAGMAFSKGVQDGRLEALANVERVASTAAALPHQTPLDRLSARAQAGDPVAELNIGIRYLDGTDTPKDPAAALHWMTLSAIHGQPVAQYLLGTLYEKGVGASADAGKALQWFEAAALQGNRKAMHNLAIAYAEGLGTDKTPSEAARWFSRAASFGYVDSEFDLAVLYERGDGVPQSLLDAYKWYAVAGRQGDAESKQRIEALRTQLSGDDLAAAQRAADAFHALPYDMAANTAPAE